MGHTDRICIGDCGLPIPNETEKIDLALMKFGQPRFLEKSLYMEEKFRIRVHSRQ